MSICMYDKCDALALSGYQSGYGFLSFTSELYFLILIFLFGYRENVENAHPMAFYMGYFLHII